MDRDKGQEPKYIQIDGEPTAVYKEPVEAEATEKTYTKDQVLVMIKEVIADGYILEDKQGKIKIERDSSDDSEGGGTPTVNP